jgi:3',5'-cyclic AMP phosphodiesterase CpdA
VTRFRFAHLSDWHATTLAGGGRGLLRPKRISGWLSWRFSRRFRHDEKILAAAIRDVRSLELDRILVTGDLTHVSLASEFARSAEQLTALGSPDHVFLIPGNHDCYVPVAPEQSWDLWADYLRGADPAEIDPALADCLGSGPAPDRAPTHGDYPTLRLHEGVAFIGLCSAIPTPIFRAGGELGETQLDRLERLLCALDAKGLARIVMIHHPVAVSTEPVRRALWDAEALRGVLERAGAELVIHGHKHRRRVNYVPGPSGEIPVIGVPSSSEVGSRPEKQAQYHVYTLQSEGSGGPRRIEAEIRGWDPEAQAFVEVDERLF